MMRWIPFAFAIVATTCRCVVAAAPDLPAALQILRSIDKEGKGNAAATAAWKSVAQADANELPTILAAFDGSNPLTINYLQTAVEAVLQHGSKPPIAELERFLNDAKHSPEARRLAFELVVKDDPKKREPLLEGSLNDPSAEIRRDAVQLAVDRAEAALKLKRNDEAISLFQKAIDAARDPDQVASIAKKLSSLGKPVDVPTQFGFVMNWRLIGPFDNGGGKGYPAVYPPEQAVDFTGEYAGKSAKVKWFDHQATNENGIVDLNKALGRFKGAVAYAASEFTCDKAQNVELRLGSVTAWKVWVNGRPLFQRQESHSGPMAIDQFRVPVSLREGRNVILLKLCQNEQKEPWAQDWEFQLRASDATGRGVLSTTRPPSGARPADAK